MFISSTYILLEEKKKTLQNEILIYQLFLYFIFYICIIKLRN